MKVALVVFAVLVLIGGGAGAFFLVNGNIEESNEPNDNSSQSTDSEDTTDNNPNDEVEQTDVAAIVEYDGAEFAPASVTVETGSTVRFVNNGSRTMWVASDDHPAHTDLPDFDNKGGIAPGEVYEFTFSEAGTWGYHDHLNASAIGSVEVVAPAE